MRWPLGTVGEVHLGTEDGVVVLVPPHDASGVGLEWRVERDEDGAEDSLGNMLKRIHPVCLRAISVLFMDVGHEASAYMS